MLIACWSSQGGSGTTVVAAALSLLLARNQPPGSVLADLTGDAPAVLGSSAPDQPGLAGWLAAGEAVPADALARLEVEASSGLGLLHRGDGPLEASRARVLGSLLDHSHRQVVADCGNLAVNRACPAAQEVARAATHSLLVIKPSYLALSHASESPVRASGAVVVLGCRRLMGRNDVERAVGAPVVTQIPEDPAVANAVDAGLLSGTLPRTLARGLDHVL